MLLCHKTGLPNLRPHLASDLCEEGKMFHTFFFKLTLMTWFPVIARISPVTGEHFSL